MHTEQDLIGTAEVARMFGKSHRTVHRMVQSGELTPAVKAPGGFAGTFLFIRADIERKVASDRAAS